MPNTAAYPELIIEQALKAPPIEQAFDEPFKEEFRAIVAEFARHFKLNGWNRTQFQCYMNDKYYYKDPKEGGRGSSWWLLDEPMARDDFLADRFFGRLFEEGLRQAGAGGRGPQMAFRCDVSRPQWQRDWLSGLVNLMCVSGEFFRKNDRCLQQKRTEHVTFWHYGTGNDNRASNLAGEAWALTAYLAGADGIL